MNAMSGTHISMIERYGLVDESDDENEFVASLNVDEDIKRLIQVNRSDQIGKSNIELQGKNTQIRELKQLLSGSSEFAASADPKSNIKRRTRRERNFAWSKKDTITFPYSQ